MNYVIAGLSLLILVACQTPGGDFPHRYIADEASYTVTDSSEILIVYVGAQDCPPCLTFKARRYPVWIKSAEYKHVIYRELSFPSYKRTDEDNYWPKDLRWVRENAFARRGAPRWIVSVDGRIIANQRSWGRQTYPLIQRLVARKLKG